MKKNTICILFVSLLLMSCGTTDDKGDIQSYLDETLRLYQEHNEDTAAIAKVLTDGLAAYPENIPLLQSRASLYCSRTMLKECRADIQHLLRLKPDLAEPQMALCMLDELEGMDSKFYESCYLKAADMFAARLSTSSSDAETGNKMNHVFALLMARHPDAEKEKAAFLSNVATDPQARIYHGILDDFNRERFLREAFGQ